MSLETSSLEDTLNKAYEDFSRVATEKYEDCEQKIRSAPIASVLFALAAGYVLNFLPTCRIVGGLVRLVLFLIKPAVFLFGLVKVIDYAKAQSAKADVSERDPVLDSPPGV